MNKYTTHCTEEQTKKAFELGAPIVILPNYEEYSGFPFVRHTNGNEYPCVIPTAEQMIGWLEEREDIDEIAPMKKGDYWVYVVYMAGIWSDIESPEDAFYPTRKEATLAAIDAALDYLSK